MTSLASTSVMEFTVRVFFPLFSLWVCLGDLTAKVELSKGPVIQGLWLAALGCHHLRSSLGSSNFSFIKGAKYLPCTCGVHRGIARHLEMWG